MVRSVLNTAYNIIFYLFVLHEITRNCCIVYVIIIDRMQQNRSAIPISVALD